MCAQPRQAVVESVDSAPSADDTMRDLSRTKCCLTQEDGQVQRKTCKSIDVPSRQFRKPKVEHVRKDARGL